MRLYSIFIIKIINVYRILSIVSISLFLSLGIQSQTTEERVNSFFEEEKPIECFKFFRGRMNDVNDVMIALGSNGKGEYFDNNFNLDHCFTVFYVSAYCYLNTANYQKLT